MSVTNILKLIVIFSILMEMKCFPLNQYEYNDEELHKNHLNEDASSRETDFYSDELKKIEIERYFDIILEKYFEKYIEPYLAENVEYLSRKAEAIKAESKYAKYFDEIESKDEQEESEKMQGDMPETDSAVKVDSDSLKIVLSSANETNFNLTNMLMNATSLNGKKGREKTRSEWLDLLKIRVLEETGRKNNTGTLSPEVLEQFRNSLNGSVAGLPLSGRHHHYDHVNGELENSEYSEKVRSFYPSCETPRNTDEEVWKDLNTMNLFFNVDYNGGSASGSGTGQQNQEEVVNIASATLRLYRLPQETNTTVAENCQKSDNSHSVSDEDKQIRVSVYWYLRSLKKHKVVKKRLADSRMVPLMDRQGGTQYVEFNIRPAAKSWVKGRNLGLGIIVEDMDGAILPAEKHFKGINCDTVGNFSTPKPIPSKILDALRNSAGFGNLVNGSSTTAFNYYSLMPKLDICIIELPHNLSAEGQSKIDTSRIRCKILKSNDEFPTSERHIRHQHHIASDPRNKFVSKRLVLNSSELHSLSRQLQKESIGSVNR